MKDRIRKIMESKHMNQQSFAAYIGIAPASLSSMLQERTRPTLNTVEAIMKKIPQINLTWLISGEGDMYSSSTVSTSSISQTPQNTTSLFEPSIEFGDSEVVTPKPIEKNLKESKLEVKNIDNIKRTITEIRVFYDDQTWESFVPKK